MKNSRFIQIAVDPNEPGQKCDLYALDANGAVWQYERGTESWFVLPATRSKFENPIK